nr:peptide-methionine (R)-S-oxide reductase MsrB [uncultured Sphingomonas sp.]
MDLDMTKRGFLGGSLTALGGLLAGCGPSEAKERFEITRSEEEWRRILPPERFAVLRKESTERPRSSPLNAEKRRGIYACAGCALPLYRSETKYESGTGWPSFFAPIADAVRTKPDGFGPFKRTEVHCRRCGGHLGHVFDDGPPPTGKRYCMNGAAMVFRAA